MPALQADFFRNRRLPPLLLCRLIVSPLSLLFATFVSLNVVLLSIRATPCVAFHVVARLPVAGHAPWHGRTHLSSTLTACVSSNVPAPSRIPANMVAVSTFLAAMSSPMSHSNSSGYTTRVGNKSLSQLRHFLAQNSRNKIRQQNCPILKYSHIFAQIGLWLTLSWDGFL